MKLVWQDYSPEAMEFVENWLDDSAIASTGLEEGFCDFYTYWAQEDGFAVGKNFWCKVIFLHGDPVAIAALCLHEEITTIMQIIVAPHKRRQGIGTRLLKQLLDGDAILGFTVQKSDAVIYPDNIASQKAFENAGYRHFRTHQDDNGTSMHYAYERVSNALINP